MAHFGGAGGAFLTGGLAGWIAPLIALLARGNTPNAVRAHALNALNFQILWSIIALIGYVTMCAVVGLFIALAAWLVASIIGVIAGVKATNGEPYQYPMTIRMIK